MLVVEVSQNTQGRNDETMPIINKPKHPEKGAIQGTKWKNPHLRRQKNHLWKQTTKGHQVPNPIPSWKAYQIGKGEDFFKGPSPMATTHFKIKINCACYNAIDSICL